MEIRVELNSEKPTYTTDVVVVGGGPAGFCAAVAASRNGAQTVLIEQGNYCGGMATRGLVGPLMTSYDKDGKHMIIRGLYEELVERMVERKGAIHPSEVRKGTAYTSWIEVGHDHVTPFSPDTMKKVIDDMLLESGVKILYNTSFVQPIMEENYIKGIIIFSKSGFQAVHAKVVIDCSGDADIAARAGVPFQIGNENLGITQPASKLFRIGNVDSEKVEADIQANIHNFYRKNGTNYRSFHWRVEEARKAGDWKLDRVSIGMFKSVNDEWVINTSRIMGIDGTDNESLTHGEIEGRKQVEEIFQFIKKYIPGCENAKLLEVSDALGVRESRHIQGMYCLDVEDILKGNIPDDSVIIASNSVDVHGKYGPTSNEYLTVQDGQYYGISYRCLVPVKVEQLLVAGRSVSATSDAAAAIRVMPPSMGLGQAAGTAAALAVKDHCLVRDVEASKLQKVLVSQNAYLPFV